MSFDLELPKWDGPEVQCDVTISFAFSHCSKILTKHLRKYQSWLFNKPPPMSLWLFEIDSDA